MIGSATFAVKPGAILQQADSADGPWQDTPDNRTVTRQFYRQVADGDFGRVLTEPQSLASVDAAIRAHLDQRRRILFGEV